VSGGLAYLAGSVLVFSGLGGAPLEFVEAGLLVAGSALIGIGFLVDARAKRKPPKRDEP
jgi:hypothetical protein